MFIFRVNGDTIFFNNGRRLEFSSEYLSYCDFNVLRNFLIGYGADPVSFSYDRFKGYSIKYPLSHPVFEFDEIEIVRKDPGETNRYIELKFKGVTSQGKTGDCVVYLHGVLEDSAPHGPYTMTCNYVEHSGEVIDSVTFLME